MIKTDINFYLARSKTTLHDFLKGVLVVQVAIDTFERLGLVNYDLEEVEKIIANNVHIENASKGGSNPRRVRKPQTRKKRPKVAKESKKEKKDSSDFKTWKVPYVEPE